MRTNRTGAPKKQRTERRQKTRQRFEEVTRNMKPKKRVAEMIVVLVTCRSKREAEKIARTLVTKRLVACGNILGFDVRSIYAWKAKIESAHETLLILKTTRERFDQMESEIRRMHSYDVPEIIAMPVAAVSAQYLKWVVENSSDKTNSSLAWVAGSTRPSDR
jgi:periplasmic divalent cation tolerance protein